MCRKVDNSGCGAALRTGVSPLTLRIHDVYPSVAAICTGYHVILSVDDTSIHEQEEPYRILLSAEQRYRDAQRCGSGAADSGSDAGADTVCRRLQPVVRCCVGMRRPWWSSLVLSPLVPRCHAPRNHCAKASTWAASPVATRRRCVRASDSGRRPNMRSTNVSISPWKVTVAAAVPAGSTQTLSPSITMSCSRALTPVSAHR
jgi:hypothetical protein